MSVSARSHSSTTMHSYIGSGLRAGRRVEELLGHIDEVVHELDTKADTAVAVRACRTTARESGTMQPRSRAGISAARPK